MRGLTLFRLGRPADAIPLLEKAPAKMSRPRPTLPTCWRFAIWTPAATTMRATPSLPNTDSRPTPPPPICWSARMLFRREYVPVAQRFATTALSLDPQLPLANELLGEIALAGNKFDEAVTYFEKEKTRNPLEASIYERLGDAYSRAARYPDARLVLQQAILLEPNATGPYILLGKVNLKEGDATAAATFLEKAVRMDPGNPMSHSLLGQAYRAMGRTEEASREMAITQKIHDADQPKLSSPQ